MANGSYATLDQNTSGARPVHPCLSRKGYQERRGEPS